MNSSTERQRVPKIVTGALLLIWFGFTLATAPTAPAQRDQTTSTPPQEKGAAARLEPGQAIETALAGGETRSFEIQVNDGQFLHAVVGQLGIHVALKLYGPDGKLIAATENPNGTTGVQQISTIAEVSGAYKLEIASWGKNTPAGRCRVSVEPLRPATDADRARVSAERTLFEAGHLSFQRDAEMRRRAAQKYEEALALWRSAGDAYEQGLTLNRAGVVYQGLGEQQKALDCFNQALVVERAAGDLEGEGVTLINVGWFYEVLHERRKALDYYDQALPAMHAASDPDGEARAANSIANIYAALSEKQKALDYLNQALPLARAAGDHGLEAITLNSTGKVYGDLGEKQKALDYLNQAIDVERSMGDPIAEAVTLNNIGAVYDALSEKQKALDCYIHALALRNANGGHAAAVVTLNNIGKIYADLGEQQKALDYLNQALILRRNSGDKVGEAVVLSNIGRVYADLGEKQKALDNFNQALILERDAGEPSDQAVSLSNIGAVYNDLGEKQKALDYYDKALSLKRTEGDPSGEAVALSNIGAVYDDLGEKQKALDYYNQALVLERELGDRYEEGVTTNNVGKAYDDLGEKTLALSNYSQALAFDRESKDHLSESIVLSNLMAFWRRNGEPATGIFYGKQAVNQIQQLRSNNRGLENEAQRSFLQSKEKTYRELADLLITQDRLPEAQQVLDLLKNEEYFEFIRRDGKEASSLTAPVAFTKSESELNGKYEEGAGRITAIADEWAALRSKPSRTVEEDKRLAELNEQIKAANRDWEKFLSDIQAGLKNSKGAKETAEDLEERASGMKSQLLQLDAGTVALYTLVGDEKYQVILVTRSVILARAYSIPAAELRRKVLAFRQTLQDPAKDPVPLAQDLYKILVGPIASELDGAQATTLMWSLDDVLSYLPISALHDGHDYLVAKYRNEVFTPASIPHLSDRPDVKNWSGLAMGVSKSYGNFSALPSVRDELHRIIQEKGTEGVKGVMPGRTMLDDEFTEDNMKKALEKGYPLVHIASHFDFKPGNELKSFLLLGGSDAQGEQLTLAEIREDPEFDFHGTDLLTLSACDTAMGGEAGDGREVDGLGRLAQQKGAKAVVATLWSVNDESTGLLMQEFYRLWIANAGMPKGEALREAQVALLHGKAGFTEATKGAKPDATTNHAASATARGVSPGVSTESDSYSHPYYWAPFILIGNWR